LIGIDLEKSEAADISIVTAVATKAASTSVAHPELVFAGIHVFGEHAVVVRVVVAAGNGFDVLFNKGVSEVGVEAGSCHDFFPTAHDRALSVAVLWEWNVNECHVEMSVSVAAVRLFQTLGGVLEPTDLTGLDPVIAFELGFVRRIGVGIEEVERDGGMLVVALSQYLNIVVADTIDLVGAGLGQRVGKRFV